MATIWKLLQGDGSTEAVSVDSDGNLVVAGSITAASQISSSGNVTMPAALAVVGNLAVNTDKFSVAAASGNTVVAGTMAVTGASALTGVATFTGKDVHSNGITIASAKNVEGAGTGANGFLIKNPKNAAAGTLSGTALNVEIDIGGTPYYFAVYPTKS